MRVAWRTVGSIITRVCRDIDTRVDRLAGLRRIGIDEISYRKGRKFLTVVVDHDTGRLVWARPGRDAATLDTFFVELGPDRAAQLTHVSADTASWIGRTVARRAPQAIVCADPFHVVAWATQCLDDVRRQVWNQARRQPGGMAAAGSHVGLRYNLSRGAAQKIQRSRYALWKNPEDLTENQRAKLAWIATTSPTLHRAYLLKGPPARFQSRWRKRVSKRSTGGWPGPDAAGSRPSSCSARRFVDTFPRSTPACANRCRTLSWSRSTPRSGSSPESPSGSTARTPHRARHAQPRRLPTPPPRPGLTHTSGRRASYPQISQSLFRSGSAVR